MFKPIMMLLWFMILIQIFLEDLVILVVFIVVFNEIFFVYTHIYTHTCVKIRYQIEVVITWFYLFYYYIHTRAFLVICKHLFTHSNHVATTLRFQLFTLMITTIFPFLFVYSHKFIFVVIITFLFNFLFVLESRFLVFLFLNTFICMFVWSYTRINNCNVLIV